MMDEPNGSHTLVKHMFVGTNQPRMLTTKLLEVSHGKVYCLDIAKFKARRLVPQSVQWLLHGLGGVGLFRKAFVMPEHKKSFSLTPKSKWPSSTSRKTLHWACP